MKAGIKSPKRVCMLINEIFKVIKIFFFKASVYSSCSINVNGNTKKDRSTAKQRGSKTNTDPNPDSKLLPTAKKKRKSSNVEGASAEHVKKNKKSKAPSYQTTPTKRLENDFGNLRKMSQCRFDQREKHYSCVRRRIYQCCIRI